MKSRILFRCTNLDCIVYNKDIELKDPDLSIDKCKKCYEPGKLKITHGKESFNSAGELIQYFRGLSNELKPLLKKLKN